MKKKHKQPTHRPPLTEHEKIWLFCTAIRSDAVFEEASQLVRDEHFSNGERWLALVWRVVRAFHRETGALPSKKLILTRCNADLKLDPNCIGEGDETRIAGFLKTAFVLEEEDMPVVAATAALRKFLEDRLVVAAQEAFSRPQTPLTLADTFSGLTAKAEQAASLGRGTVLPVGLIVVCHPPGRDGRCHAKVSLGELGHDHIFNPLDQFQRELFVGKASEKLRLPQAARKELEERVLAEARRGAIEHTVATVTTVADVVSEPVDWLWRGRLAFGAIALLVGPPEKGKSTIALDIAARLSRGREMPEFTGTLRRDDFIAPRLRPQPIASLLLVAEDNFSTTVRPRLLAAGANLNHIHHFESIRIGDEPERPPQLPSDIPMIERTMVERRARLLVIDVLGCFLADGMSLNEDVAMRQTLTPLKQMAERINAAVLIILHINKKTGLGVLDRISGSTAIGAAARSVLLASQDPIDSENYVLAVAKNNLGSRRESLAYRFQERNVEEVDTSRIDWTGPSPLTAGDLLLTGRSGPTKLQQAEAIITRMIDARQNGAAEILAACRAADISERTFYAARSRLGVIRRRSGFGTGGIQMLQLPGDNGQRQQDGP